MTGPAIAYLNWGRWVADCPAADCTNALAVAPGQTSFSCARPPGCGTVAVLDWPADPALDFAEVEGLPVAQQSMPFPTDELSLEAQ